MKQSGATIRSALLCAIPSAAIALAAMAAERSPTGCLVPGLEAFDIEITRLMAKWDLPGGALAVAQDGRLVVARGYGVADKKSGAAVVPTTKFRLGSLAKPVTAVAVLQLSEQGKLSLDDRILPLLGNDAPPSELIRDPRVRDITVRHLLQHRGGFDRDRSGDPVFMPRATAALERQKAAAPPTCAVIARDTLERDLDFTPGERYAYSNLGYCILGRIVERITGTPLIDYLRGHVLVPAGAGEIILGHTMRSAPGEATYYDYPDAPKVQAMPGVASGRVAAPYGEYAVEQMEAYGGWTGSPLDYLRFFLAIDGRHGSALLREATFKDMLSPGLDSRRPIFMGLGVVARDLGNGKRNWWHDGSQPGATTFAVRTSDGHAWVAAFNSRPRDRTHFFNDLDQALWAAARRANWRAGDLWSKAPCA